MISFKIRTFSIAILICSSFSIKAQNLTRSLDLLLNGYVKKGQFDGAILVAKGKKIIYNKQYGWSNRQFKVPIDSNTKFPIASITKLYTAILILQLQESRALSIDSTVNLYLPDILKKTSSKITIRQLLNHTSGLPNESVKAYSTPYKLQEFLNNCISDTLINQPGTKYSYNNVNYILLGAIIEKLTSKKWTEVVKEKISIPLNLKNTDAVKKDSVISNLAYGYHNYAFGDTVNVPPLKNDVPIYMENYGTAGALFSTPSDMFKLHLALLNHTLLSKKSTDLMYTGDVKISKVSDTDYYVGLGSYVGNRVLKPNTTAVKMIQRNGNINGFNATYIQLPERNETVIIFCNTDAGDLDLIADEVVFLLLSGNK